MECESYHRPLVAAWAARVMLTASCSYVCSISSCIPRPKGPPCLLRSRCNGRGRTGEQLCLVVLILLQTQSFRQAVDVRTGGSMTN